MLGRYSILGLRREVAEVTIVLIVLRYLPT